jgi:putative peptidoglycan lipid II flippase
MAGVLVVSGTSSILAAVLNAHEHFAVTALAPVAVPVSMVLGFWLLQDRFGIYALAGGTLAGFVIECKLLAFAAWRLGLVGWPRWTWPDGSLAHVGSQYWPVLVGSLLMTSSAVVDQSMAASLSSGAVSILSYGGKVVALVLSMVAASLATVLFPRFSRIIASGDWNELSQTMRAYTVSVVLGSIPVVAALAILAEPMIRLLFEHGAFTLENTVAAAGVQAWLALQVPFYVLAMLGARVLSAMDANQIVLRIGALNLGMNVAGNYILMRWFGVNGIAMSTSLMYLVAAVVTLAAVRARTAESGGGTSPATRQGGGEHDQ